MGGFGSGRYGYGSSSTTEELHRVDIRFVRKRFGLLPGACGSIRWSCAGDSTGSVRFDITADTFVLDYRVRESGAEAWEPVTLRIPLTSTLCRYGGKRYYFLCPAVGCGRRCEILYSAGRYFVCRKCAGCLYSSQTGCPIDRLIDAKHKLGRRIFEDYDGQGGLKKRDMHWKTFDRLYARYRDYDERTELGLAQLIGWDEA